jgi:hypothetical protein
MAPAQVVATGSIPLGDRRQGRLVVSRVRLACGNLRGILGLRRAAFVGAATAAEAGRHYKEGPCDVGARVHSPYRILAGENISWLSAFGAAGGQTARPSMNSQMRTRGFIAVNIRINIATGVLRATKRVSTRKGGMHANDAGVVST